MGHRDDTIRVQGKGPVSPLSEDVQDFGDTSVVVGGGTGGGSLGWVEGWSGASVSPGVFYYERPLSPSRPGNTTLTYDRGVRTLRTFFLRLLRPLARSRRPRLTLDRALVALRDLHVHFFEVLLDLADVRPGLGVRDGRKRLDLRESERWEMREVFVDARVDLVHLFQSGPAPRDPPYVPPESVENLRLDQVRRGPYRWEDSRRRVVTRS